ncbi:MAG: COP23 domain-containing protein [Hormoscilla sp.]
MNFPYRLSAALVGTAMVAAQLPFSVAVAQDVSTIAEEITVRIDGPKAGGSGVIVKREGNDYTVLTNWHVVDNAGDYVIQTSDGKRHRVNYRQEMSGLDLARLQFTSTQSYRVAELGNSENVSRNQSVYVSGWLNPIPGINERSYQFIEGKITSILSGSEDGGYALVYSNIGTYKGMSGGPLLNEQGQVVGINGRAAGDSITGPVGLYLGIPISRFLTARNTWEQLLALPAVNTSTSGSDSAMFYYDKYNNDRPQTIFRTARGDRPLIIWVSDYYSAYGFTPEKMCEAVSARFEFYYENEMLKYIGHGIVDGYPVICVRESGNQRCTTEGVLLLLKPSDDPQKFIRGLLEARSGVIPISW